MIIPWKNRLQKQALSISSSEVLFLTLVILGCSNQPNREDAEEVIGNRLPELLHIINDRMSADQITTAFREIEIQEQEIAGERRFWRVRAGLVFTLKEDQGDGSVEFNLNGILTHDEGGHWVLVNSEHVADFSFSDLEIVNRSGLFLPPEIVFSQVDKSRHRTSADAFGIPRNVVTGDNRLVAEVIKSYSWIVGLKTYFYLDNLGGDGAVRLRLAYSDDLGTSQEKEEVFEVLRLKKYRVEVTIAFKANVSVGPDTYDLARRNIIEITLPNGNKDSFSARIPSWQGDISSVRLSRVD